MASTARLTVKATMLTLPPLNAESPVLLFGMECRFTSAVLQNILANGLTVSGMILPGPLHLNGPLRANPRSDPLLPIATQSTQPTVMQLANTARIPVFRVGNLRTETEYAFVSSLTADWLLSVCYPRLIPGQLLDALKLPAMNVHPSLLPQLRGPDPLFWTFHEGTGKAGVTIHLLSKHFDSGQIVAQHAISFEAGTTETDLEDSLAIVAGEALSRIAGDLSNWVENAVSQQHDLATWARFPEGDDYCIDDSWTVRRARTFVSGVSSRGVQIRYISEGSEFQISDLAADRSRESMPGTKLLRFADGHAVATIG